MELCFAAGVVRTNVRAQPVQVVMPCSACQDLAYQQGLPWRHQPRSGLGLVSDWAEAWA